LELGYRFENQMRVSVAYSHISNANLSETNPGVDIISAYLHFPVDMIIGN
jgi:lipid A 3-O-deacylase